MARNMLDKRITRDRLEELNTTKVIKWSKDCMPTFYNGYMGARNFTNFLLSELTKASDIIQDDFCLVFGLD